MTKGRGLTQDQINSIIACARQGMAIKAIARHLKMNYQTVAKYVHLFRTREKVPTELLDPPNSSMAINQLQIENVQAAAAAQPPPNPDPLAAAPPPPPPTVPLEPEAMQERLENLAARMLNGADKLAYSIESLTDIELAGLSVKDRANALGTLVDKIKQITGKGPQLVKDIENANLNLITIISSSVAPRKKDEGNEPINITPKKEDLLA